VELVLSEEHDLVSRGAREWVRDRSPIARAREGGFSRERWREMTELGWLGLVGEGEWVYAMLVLEELGRGLVPEPVLPVLWAAAARVDVAGGRVVVPALDERGARFAYGGPGTRVADGALSGEKTQVVGAPSADAFLVSAGGRLYLVAASDAEVEPQRRLDGREAGLVRLRGARGEEVGEVEPLLARAAILLSAEMVGAASAAYERTLEYLKARRQFGVPIGSFQALQHRAARLFVDLELARGAVEAAHALLAAGGAAEAEVARAASVAKAKCSDVFVAVAHEAIQMHGGIGMTEEHDIGLFLKRARVAEMTLGDAAHHRDRYARLKGF
jgi:alkylation response protein AidB-like acyl-CoA dehydrogenase